MCRMDKFGEYKLSVVWGVLKLHILSPTSVGTEAMKKCYLSELIDVIDITEIGK